MALIANNCVRFTIAGNINGNHTWANIWDIRMLGGIDDDRAQGCADYAETLMEVWQNTVMQSLSAATTMESVNWVDLDSDTGSTGLITSFTGEAPPYVGDQTGDPAPPSVSALVTKQTTAARGSRNGRLYISGLRDEDTTVDGPSTGFSGVTQTRLDSALDALTDPPSVPDFSCLPTVIHTTNVGTPTNPNIVYAGNSVINALVLQPLLATQRRRLRR